MNNRRMESSCYLRQLIGIKLCHLVGGGVRAGKEERIRNRRNFAECENGYVWLCASVRSQVPCLLAIGFPVALHLHFTSQSSQATQSCHFTRPSVGWCSCFIKYINLKPLNFYHSGSLNYPFEKKGNFVLSI